MVEKGGGMGGRARGSGGRVLWNRRRIKSVGFWGLGMARIREGVGVMLALGLGRGRGRGAEEEEGGTTIAIARTIVIIMTSMIGGAARGIGMEGVLGGVGGMITIDDDDDAAVLDD